MMVTFISQCEKNVLKKIRRVLDAFADTRVVGWPSICLQWGNLATIKNIQSGAYLHDLFAKLAIACYPDNNFIFSEIISGGGILFVPPYRL